MRRAISIHRYAGSHLVASASGLRAIRWGEATTLHVVLDLPPGIEQDLSDLRGSPDRSAVGVTGRGEQAQAGLEAWPVRIVHDGGVQDSEGRRLSGRQQLFVAEHEQLLVTELPRRYGGHCAQ